MSTPSRSRSFARGKEGYFEWRDNMERQQRENERQPRNSRFNQEAMHPGDASPPLDAHAEWPREAPRPTRHEQWEESSDST
ncbi:hypothetical protein CK203_053204 [Vitis vinifera]|uniref:Uncharacterized protein n=1 Tax=Vitis vinifera TaxID=29760 RepID=A0A438GJX0_VITVI|nr:hypothetical protein CK203_053204 [Vitis vinifera]